MSRGHQPPSDRIVGETAWLYYVKNLTQGEIAKQLGISRPTVISYLRLAKEREIVCVKISAEHFRLNSLADELVARFGLDSALVVPDEGVRAEPLTRLVCEAAAHILPDFVVPGDQLGVSWGQTVSFVSEALPNWPVPGLIVRQLIGSIANPLLPTSESCSTEIARRLSAECVNLNAPAICSSVELARMLRGEPIIAEQLDNLRLCNKSIFSLSPCTHDTHVVQFKLATPADIDIYTRNGAVGIISGQFFDAEGMPVAGPLDDRLICASLPTMRTMTGLLVVSGLHKLEATRSALRGGYANRLVLDSLLAEALLANSALSA